MLVLSRKLGEKIVIGDGITLTVVKIDGDKVRLGIVAPEDVPIARAELLEDGKSFPAQRQVKPKAVA
jgi:carbon storage regulator